MCRLHIHGMCALCGGIVWMSLHEDMVRPCQTAPSGRYHRENLHTPNMHCILLKPFCLINRAFLGL